MIQGTKQELKFWEAFVKTPRFLNDWCSNEKTSELDDDVAEFILKNCPEYGSILDCGSGAVSVLHGLRNDIEIYPADLLAIGYEKIFDYKKHNLLPPLPYASEDLPLEFWKESFHIVHMRNALDHTQDPVKAYNSMLACVKPGGYLIIQGFENEGTFENWQGMHQWDISVGALTPALILQSKNSQVILSTKPYYHKCEILNTGKDWFVWIVKKHSNE